MSLWDTLWDNFGYGLVFLFTFVDAGISLAVASVMVHDGTLSFFGVLGAAITTIAVRVWFKKRRLFSLRLFRTRALVTFQGVVWVVLISALGFGFAHVFEPDARLRLSLSLWILVLFAVIWVRLQRDRDQRQYRALLRTTARLWRRRRWLAPLVGLIVLAPWFSTSASQAPAALASDFERRGLKIQNRALAWVDKNLAGIRATLHGGRALVAASREGEPADVYLLKIGLSHEGSPTRLHSLYNLTDTAAVEEVGLTVHGSFAAWRIEVGGKTTSVEVADLRGQLPLRGDDWTLLTKTQNALTNLQETGQVRGIARMTIKPGTPAPDARMRFDRDSLFLDMNQHSLHFDLRNHELTNGGSATARVHEVSLPGNLTTWAVDRVRAIPWIGSDGMQWIKGVAFNAASHIEDLEQDVIGTDVDTRVKEELGDAVELLPVAKAGSIPGWPPAPIKPLLPVPLPGEGTWTSLDDNAFVSTTPGTPSPFLFTFVRIDPKRPYSQISITLWDPRQVRLHIVAGTVEPKSTTGEIGTGMIPREPEVLTRLVGAFNGAFQSIHGAFGMMVNDTVLLPPKPYAATVATLRDGTTAFGTWPTTAEIPLELRSYRQNMTPLILGSRKNPYHRHWWGGMPEGWTEETRTVRSGICMTRDHFVGYFYGLSIEPDQLAESMRLAGCTYGVHLDMNGGHAGFEFYKVAPRGKLKSPERALDPVWEAKGLVPQADDYEFMSRLMVRKMPLQNFPRYIKRDSRDYFYLTLRKLLPDAPIKLPKPTRPKDGVWSAVDAPGNQWPHVLATTRLTVQRDSARTEVVQLLKIDPKVTEAVDASDEPEGQALLGLTYMKKQDHKAAAPLSIWWRPRGFAVSRERPTGAKLVAQGLDKPELFTPASACVAPDGMLIVAETIEFYAKNSEALVKAMKLAGCTQFLYLLEHPLVGSKVGTKSALPNASKTLLVRRPFFGVKRIFVDTKVVLPSRWAIPQRKAVKFVPKPRPDD